MRFSTSIYTPKLLLEQYVLHKTYVLKRMNTTGSLSVKVRLPAIPEDISENIICSIIHNKLNDTTTTRNYAGDLYSHKEGQQECKCFTSNGPISFSPSNYWDVLYFLDARLWLKDEFILYRVPLSRRSVEWENIKVNRIQTFSEQAYEGRRPRIKWTALYPQIESYCDTVFNGTLEDLFHKKM